MFIIIFVVVHQILDRGYQVGLFPRVEIYQLDDGFKLVVDI